MKAQKKWVLLGLFLTAFVVITCPVVTAQAPVTLTVYNPTGAFEVTQSFAPRLTDLNGKTICLSSNNRWEADRILPLVSQLLQKQFPTAKIVPATEFVVTGEMTDKAIGDTLKAKACQGVILSSAG